MAIGASIISNLVPISEFSKGGAGRIFARTADGPVVIVRNNAPIAVVVSIEEFNRLTSAAEGAQTKE